MAANLSSQSSSRPCEVPRSAHSDSVAMVVASLKESKFDLYFDTLDDNGLHHVSKYLRAKPWPSFTRVAHILPLLHVRGELSYFLRQRCFNTLHIVKEPDYQEPIVAGEIWSTDLDSALQFVSLAGRFLHTIHLDLDYSTKPVPMVDWDTLEWARAFSSNCPNVCSLVIAVGGHFWIRVFGCRLESLEFICPPVVVIEDHCSRLRKLTLWGSSDLKSLGGKVWEKIGSTLETLDITFIWAVSYGTFPDDVGKIQKYCRALKRITVTTTTNHEPDMISALSQLLTSYGKQLEYASVFDFPELELKTLVEACPNAEFELVVKHTCLLTALQILGLQLKMAIIHNTKGVYKHEELARGWKSCSNLDDISFIMSEISEIRSFFAHPKPSIKSVLVEHSDEDLPEIIDLIARGTGNIEDFEIECNHMSQCKFDALAERNQKLGFFAIQFHLEAPSSRTVRKTIDITHSLLKAPILKSLHIGVGSDDCWMPRRLWNTLARRGIDFHCQK